MKRIIIGAIAFLTFVIGSFLALSALLIGVGYKKADKNADGLQKGI